MTELFLGGISNDVPKGILTFLSLIFYYFAIKFLDDLVDYFIKFGEIEYLKFKTNHRTRNLLTLYKQ